MVAHVIFYFFSRFNKTTAWLRSLSFAPNTSVSVPRAFLRLLQFRQFCLLRQLRPPPIVPVCVQTTCAAPRSVQYRSSTDPRAHNSLLTPRGHNRSTST